jgi:hypothetical protein
VPAIRLTKEIIREMLQWEHEHQMKLFPFMEEENDIAGDDKGDISALGATGGGFFPDAIPDEPF